MFIKPKTNMSSLSLHPGSPRSSTSIFRYSPSSFLLSCSHPFFLSFFLTPVFVSFSSHSLFLLFLSVPSPSFPTSMLHRERHKACHCPSNHRAAASAPATGHHQGCRPLTPSQLLSHHMTHNPRLSARSRDRGVTHGNQR